MQSHRSVPPRAGARVWRGRLLRAVGAIALACAAAAAPVQEGARLELSVVYVGDRGDPRCGPTLAFLREHFASVSFADRALTWRDPEADVAVLAWPAEGPGPPELRHLAGHHRARWWDPPTVVLGSATGRLARAWELLGASGSDLLQSRLTPARGGDHPVFRGPLPVTLPSDPGRRPLPVVTGASGPVAGWGVDPAALEGFPGAETIASGRDPEGVPRAVVWRQDAFLHFGFDAAPEKLEPAARAVLVNLIAYAARFQGHDPAAPAVVGPDPRSSALRLFAAGRSAEAAELLAAPPGEADIEAWYARERDYLVPDPKGRLAVDADARRLGIPPPESGFLPAAIAALEADDAGERARARDLLERYAPEGPGRWASAARWREWHAGVRGRLFYSGSVGYRWAVDRGRRPPAPAAPGRQGGAGAVEPVPGTPGELLRLALEAEVGPGPALLAALVARRGETLPLLLQAVRGGGEAAVRAAAAIGAMGEAVGPAAAEIEELVAGGGPALPEGAALRLLGALGNLGADGALGLSRLALREDLPAAARRRAVAELGGLGPAAGGSLDVLARLVECGDRELERTAAEALGQLAPRLRDLGPALPPLARALEREDPGLRAYALAALARVGPAGAGAAPALARLLLAERRPAPAEEGLEAVVDALAGLGRGALPELAELAVDPGRGPVRAQARELARFALAQIEDAAVDGLLHDWLQSPRTAERLAALDVMALREHAVRHLAAAEGLLADPDPAVRQRAAFALGRLRRVDALAGALAHGDVHVRRAAAHTLGSPYLPGLDAARPALVQAAADPDELVRAYAVFALRRADPAAADEARAAAARLAADPGESERVRRLAGFTAAALDRGPGWRVRAVRGALGAAPLEAGRRDALLARLEDARAETRHAAARELARAGLDALQAGAAGELERAERTGRVEHELREWIDHLVVVMDDEWGGGPATTMLGRLGPAALPELEHDFLRPYRFPIGPPTYMELFEALAAHGEGALPVYLAGLFHWRSHGGEDAAAAIASLGDAGLVAAPFLLEAAAHHELDHGWQELRDPDFARMQRYVWPRLGPAAIPDLAEALRHRHSSVRRAAVRALGYLGAEGAEELVAALRGGLDLDPAELGLALAEAAALDPAAAGPLAAAAELLDAEDTVPLVRELVRPRGPDSAGASLAAAMGSSSRRVRGVAYAAAPLLAAAGEAAAAAVLRELERALREPRLEWDEAAAVAAALARLGGPGLDVLVAVAILPEEPLEGRLRDRRARRAEEALRAAGEAGLAAARAAAGRATGEERRALQRLCAELAN